jgi:hypothetical protein
VIVLADNDLILKLAQCDLLDQLQEILEVSPSGIFVTSTAKFQLLGRTREKGIGRCGNEETYDRLVRFLGCTQVLPAVVDVGLLAELAAIPNIDVGEQQLFASAVEVKSPILLTGDKRSLQALIDNKAVVEGVYGSLAGHVVIFESILLLALSRYGFPALKQKLLGNPKPDGMLRLVLREDMTTESLVDCLCSYAKSVSCLLAYQDELPSQIFEVRQSGS